MDCPVRSRLIAQIFRFRKLDNSNCVFLTVWTTYQTGQLWYWLQLDRVWNVWKIADYHGHGESNLLPPFNAYQPTISLCAFVVLIKWWICIPFHLKKKILCWQFGFNGSVIIKNSSYSLFICLYQITYNPSLYVEVPTRVFLFIYFFQFIWISWSFLLFLEFFWCIFLYTYHINRFFSFSLD